MSAQTKLFMDRWYALEKDEGSLLKGKRLGLIFTFGDDDPVKSGAVNAYRSFQDAAGYAGMDLVGTVYARCDKPGEIMNDKSAVARAGELAYKLAGKDIT